MAVAVKLAVEKPWGSTFIYRSVMALFSSYLFTQFTSMICPTIFMVPVISSADFALPLSVTPITISAPISRATSTGKLFFNPPSTSTISPILTGENAAGIAIEARIA